MGDLQQALVDAAEVLLEQVKRDKERSPYWRGCISDLETVEAYLNSVSEWAVLNNDLAKITYPAIVDKPTIFMHLGTVPVGWVVRMANVELGVAPIKLVVLKHNSDGMVLVRQIHPGAERLLHSSIEVIVEEEKN